MVLPNPLEQVFVNDPLPAALNEERDAINTLDGAVDDRIPFPSGAQTGDLLKWDGSKWATTETRFLEDDGRPDGRVAGPIGTRYIDRLGTTGAVEWVKRAGTADSNTGWICLAGETGPRDISGDIVKRSTATVYSAIILRSGQVVTFYVDMAMPNNVASPYTIYTLPVGFRPTHDIYGGITDNKEGADLGGTLVDNNGAINIYTPKAGVRDRYHGTWITADAWPSSYPGPAA
jgi:hypothetical protein